jgi:hypothetical protein
MPTRDDLLRLVATLPEEALPAAEMALTQMQTWPPPELVELEEQARSFEERMNERFETMRQEHPFGGGGGGGSFSLGPSRRARGRHSFGYEQDGEAVYASDIVHDDCTFTLVERIRHDETTDTVTFTLELTGPDGVKKAYEHRYNAP